MPTTRNLAILIFGEVEVLDFCGPPLDASTPWQQPPTCREWQRPQFALSINGISSAAAHDWSRR